ncbi:MAG TPA: SRPBCC family protein [Pyrinomonadaceae bacterium]|nr:SRPBCC family protein [Pyrinomonadaceae bacterium]
MAGTIEKWIEVNAPPQRVFNLFGRFENLPRWMTSVREVELLDDRRALLKAGQSAASEPVLDWDAQVTSSRPPQHIAWRAAGRGVNAEVRAEFEETRRGTVLMRVLFTEQAAGPAGAGLFGVDPAAELEASLERFKQFAEEYDEDATLIAPSADKAATVLDDEAVQSRPIPARVPAQTVPPVPPQDSAAVREERVFQTATTDEVREANTGRTSVVAPYPERGRSRRAPLIYAGLAALLALALGALLWGAARKPEEQRAANGVATTGATPDSTATAIPDAPEATPTSSDLDNPTGATGTPTTNAPPSTSDKEAGGVANETAVDSPAQSGLQDDQQEALKTALTDWVATTNSQNIAKQMAFYAPVVERYYLRNNFSRRAVMEDKKRLAERASLVNVTIGEPDITYDGEGRRAVMRFRKQYNIEGSRLSRGEVVQELKWLKTGEGWKIVSERDVRVIR